MRDVILIIEDSNELRENTAELLGLAGYDVIATCNGKEGLEQARKRTPDLVLCDIMMPELDGYGVLRAMENIPELSAVPFIFFTAKTEKSDFRLAMDLGADDYLPKPFSGDELLRVISARLKKSRLLKTRNGPADPASDAPFAGARSLEELGALSAGRVIKKLKSKDTVYMEGDTATHLCMVTSGKVKLYKINEWGKEYITEIVGTGGFFGHLALLGNHEHRQTAEAIEEGEITLIPRQDFFDLLHSNREIAIQLIRSLSESMLESEEKLLQLAYNSARKRVAEALLFIYRQYQQDENTECWFPVNRENLSAIAGISPESVSRNLTDFREEQLILSDNSNIRILNFGKLARLKC